MKAYLIHKTTTDGESCYDRILECYVTRKMAEVRLVQFEADRQKLKDKVNKCRLCPIFEYIEGVTSEEQINLGEGYCDHSAIYKIDSDYDDLSCENYASIYDNEDAEAWFKIEEVEILDSIPA